MGKGIQCTCKRCDSSSITGSRSGAHLFGAAPVRVVANANGTRQEKRKAARVAARRKRHDSGG